ncbi:MAG: YbaB/EbfC family nucleoid-associated protein [Thermoleophilia bacterium]|nr:YbaB/EbfC family nucleoid-associated protein [Thermoleophilia bacterium]
MSALAALMKNKEAVAQSMAKVQAELAERLITVEGARQPDGAPGITAVVTGQLQVVSISVSAALLATATDEPARARLGALTTAAVNAALKRAKEVAAEEIAREAKALGLPDMPGLEKMLGA